MTAKARFWGTWVVLALFLVFIYILGTIRFHQMLQPSWKPLFLQKVEVQPWPFFLITLLLAIVLVLLAFHRLEPKDS